MANALAYESSRLEYLESQGTPVYQPPTSHGRTAAAMVPSRVPVFSYETDSTTKYPFVPRVHYESMDRKHYEQDPLFGWLVDPLGFDGLYDWGLGNYGINSFPRELFPQLPSTLRTQIAADAVRWQSRIWAETCPPYAGLMGHLRNYTVSSGMTTDVVSKTDEVLAKDLQQYLDEFAKDKTNKLARMVWDSVWNLLRDGEDAVHLIPARGCDYPRVRSIDTSWIRGPHNEITGPWSLGILTDWPKGWNEALAYHVWWPDNSHEDISPDVFKLAQLDTVGANVKRGLPICWKFRKILPMLVELITAIGVGETARQSIPFIEQFAKAVPQPGSGGKLPSIFDDDGHGQGEWMFGGERRHGDRIQPGTVPQVSKGLEVAAPPMGYAKQGSDAYQILCQAGACASNTPVWFWTGSADAENYASSLVSESPVVKLIQHIQGIVTDHYVAINEAAVNFAIAKGLFPVDSLDTCQVHCELPSPVARNRKEEIEADMQLLDRRLLSPQHVCVRHDLDFQEETDLTKEAEAAGWLDNGTAFGMPLGGKTERRCQQCQRCQRRREAGRDRQ